MTSAAAELSPLRRNLRLLWSACTYEFQKATAFRTGFFIREVLRGIERPLVMIAVYWAIFEATGNRPLNGFSLPDLIHYLLMAATLQKLTFHERVLDVSEQIFDGYMTKYMVMPFRYYILALGRFIQYTGVQTLVCAGFYLLGSLLVPEWWPQPVSLVAAAQTVILVLLGSYCLFLVYFTINILAFWLDVVWALLVMMQFISDFMRGVLIPVAMMPEAMQTVSYWLFPYWALSAPIEIFMGRLGTGAFFEGLAILAVWIVLLETIRSFVWRQGVKRFTGAGM